MPFFAALPYSLRALLRAPTFTITVVLVLALGVAVNTTIFAVVDQVLLKPFPYEAPNQLFMIWESNPALGGISANRLPATSLNFDAWRSQNHSFKAMEAFQIHTAYNLTGLKEPENLKAARATPGLFQMLGVNATWGRTFLPEDSIPGANPTVIVTHAFAQRHFGHSSPVGRILLLDDVPFTLIGVLPNEFHLPALYEGIAEYKPDVWVPLPALSVSDPPQLAKRHRLIVCGRLQGGVSLSQARSDMAAIADRLGKINPELNRGYGINVFPLDVENTDPDLRNELRVALLSGILVLLLACTNLAGLMLVRIASRRKISAIMAALGASRWRLIAPILAESVLLALAASVLAYLVSYAGVHWIVTLKPNDIHAPERLTVNWTSFTFNICVSMLTVLIFGGIPAWLTARSNLSDVLKSGSTVPSKRPVGRIFLVCGQVATALVLSIAAVLLVRSFQHLRQVDPGFRTRQVLTAHLVLPQKRYSNLSDRARFCRQLRDKLQLIPGVESVALVDNMPLYAIQYSAFEVEGKAIPDRNAAPSADHARVSPNFFQTMNVVLRRGRHFSDEDADTSPPNVAIINETVARQLWQNQDPIGRHIREMPFNGPPGPWQTVIGVVGDFRQFNIETPARPEVFWPAKDFTSMTVAVRTGTNNPSTLSSSLQQAVWAVDRDQPISDVQTVEEMIRDFSSQRQFNMFVLTGFSFFSVVLAVVGLYGLITAFISGRLHDIGVRLALGAPRRQLCLSLVVRGLPAIVAGTILGLIFSLAMKGLIAHILFQVKPLDLQTYIVVPSILIGVLILTSLSAAVRAARLDPARILRDE
jgi:putative ABC transport system permease protein